MDGQLKVGRSCAWCAGCAAPPPCCLAARFVSRAAQAAPLGAAKGWGGSFFTQGELVKACLKDL